MRAKMADTSDGNLNQHLEMMIQKRSRCEDWVASVALQEQTLLIPTTSGERRNEYDETDYVDDYSDKIGSFPDISSKRHQRAAVGRFTAALNLICEWQDCCFVKTTSKLTYFQHLKQHENKSNVPDKNFPSEYYKCRWESCNFDTAKQDHMKRHISYHGYHSLLKASALLLHDQWNFPQCKQENENRNLLPDLPCPFECGALSCDFTTNYFPSFLNHVDEHLFDLNFNPIYGKQAKCFWKACIFICLNRTRMKSHLKIHTGEKVAACSTCGATFSTNTKYMDHCSRKTPIQDEHNRCRYCLRYFSNERLLRDHLRYHVNQHKCPFCEITCSTPAVLANHIRYKHIKDRPFKCSECSFRSIKADDCISHMSVHDTDHKYKCQAEGCRFACAALQTYNNHFRSAHLMVDGPIYCCHLCTKKYKRGTLLGKHLRAVHKLERPPGHSRFRYMEGITGEYKVQVERYESIEADNENINDVKASEEPPNFNLKYQSSDSKSHATFTVIVNRSEEFNEGALIAIDEVDETGRILRTNTVREKFIKTGFVDTSCDDSDTNTPTATVSVIKTGNDITNIYCDKLDTDSDEKSRLATALESSTALPHFKIRKRGSNYRVLSDLNISRNVISLRNE